MPAGHDSGVAGLAPCTKPTTPNFACAQFTAKNTPVSPLVCTTGGLVLEPELPHPMAGLVERSIDTEPFVRQEGSELDPGMRTSIRTLLPAGSGKVPSDAVAWLSDT